MNEPLPKDRRATWRMFDRIAHRYDLLNRLLSFKRDEVWRDVLAAHLPPTGPVRVLDLATGTGDILFSMVRRCGGRLEAYGADLSFSMLQRAKQKSDGRDAGLLFTRADAEKLPFPDAAFDAVSIAFGIRNVDDPVVALRQMLRVLRPGGQALVLEFSLPRNAILRAAYLIYFRRALPWIGGVISGDAAAYRYLNTSVEAFPHGEAFAALMREAGFTDIRLRPLTLGVATLYVGTRP